MKTKTITFILTLVAVLAPFIIAPQNPYMYSYMPKNIVLLISGAILFICILINIKHFKIDIKDVFLLIFLFLILMSTLFSPNISISIFGADMRYEGLLMFITYACIYFASKKFFKPQSIEIFLDTMFYVSLIIGILGILQNYIHNENIIPFFSRGISGTFANSNFFASYICIVLPISIILFIFNNSKKSFVLSCIMFFNLMSTCTRSAWIAFLVIGLLFFIYLIKQKNKDLLKKSLILLASFVIILIFIFSPIGCPTVRAKFNIIQNDLSLFYEEGLTDSLGSNRIEIWAMTMNLVIQKPLLGSGTDNLKNGLLKYCLNDLIDYADKHHCVIDKAHNEYLHIAATNGVPALIVYLIFLDLVLSSKIKTMFTDKKTLLFSLCIISYLVQAFFNISTLGVAPLFWMILGLSDNEFFKKGLIYE